MRGKTDDEKQYDLELDCFNEAPHLCGERRNAETEPRTVTAASMRPRIYAGKDTEPPRHSRATGTSFNEAPHLCGERR